MSHVRLDQETKPTPEWYSSYREVQKKEAELKARQKSTEAAAREVKQLEERLISYQEHGIPLKQNGQVYYVPIQTDYGRKIYQQLYSQYRQSYDKYQGLASTTRTFYEQEYQPVYQSYKSVWEKVTASMQPDYPRTYTTTPSQYVTPKPERKEIPGIDEAIVQAERAKEAALSAAERARELGAPPSESKEEFDYEEFERSRKSLEEVTNEILAREGLKDWKSTTIAGQIYSFGEQLEEKYGIFGKVIAENPALPMFSLKSAAFLLAPVEEQVRNIAYFLNPKRADMEAELAASTEKYEQLEAELDKYVKAHGITQGEKTVIPEEAYAQYETIYQKYLISGTEYSERLRQYRAVFPSTNIPDPIGGAISSANISLSWEAPFIKAEPYMSPELQEFLELPPAAQMGWVMGEIGLAWVTGKVISKALSPVAAKIKPYLPERVQKIFYTEEENLTQIYRTEPSFNLEEASEPYLKNLYLGDKNITGLSAETEKTLYRVSKEASKFAGPENLDDWVKSTLYKAKPSVPTSGIQTVSSGARQQLLIQTAKQAETATPKLYAEFTRAVTVSKVSEGIAAVTKTIVKQPLASKLLPAAVGTTMYTSLQKYIGQPYPGTKKRFRETLEIQYYTMPGTVSRYEKGQIPQVIPETKAILTQKQAEKQASKTLTLPKMPSLENINKVNPLAKQEPRLKQTLKNFLVLEPKLLPAQTQKLEEKQKLAMLYQAVPKTTITPKPLRLEELRKPRPRRGRKKWLAGWVSREWPVRDPQDYLADLVKKRKKQKKKTKNVAKKIANL